MYRYVRFGIPSKDRLLRARVTSGSTRNGHGVTAHMSPSAVTGPSPLIRAGSGIPVIGIMVAGVTAGMPVIGDIANGTNAEIC